MSTGARRFAVNAVLLALLASLGQGCTVTVTRNTMGNPIDVKAVKALKVGTSDVVEVLHRLGAPLEVHAHTDGRILVYRFRAINAFEFGIDAGTFTQFMDVTQMASSITENIKFTWERIHIDEDRVVLLLDRKGILRGIGFRDKTIDLPWF